MVMSINDQKQVQIYVVLCYSNQSTRERICTFLDTSFGLANNSYNRTTNRVNKCIHSTIHINGKNRCNYRETSING